MRILLLNQTFHPDVMATGQYLAEVAISLVQRGHQVTVVTSRRAYDQPDVRFPSREEWREIQIYRIGSTGFGKGSKWRRAADFGSFIACCCGRLALLPRHDAIMALTSPPLISFIGAWLARLWRAKFYYWVMDFNPDEAIAAGWLRPHSLVARTLERMSRFSLDQSNTIIALDRFMRDRIMAKGVSDSKIAVIPPWSHDEQVAFDPAGRNQFRHTHKLEGKFVVMYSGNHSPCHPIGTVLDAALSLKQDDGVAFCFIGGGSEFALVKQFAAQHSLQNILCLPYQPIERLSASLSAADLHLVVMGNPFVGLIHPCKLYNVLRVGAPVLYIGPQPSHITEILDQLGDQPTHCAAAHGDVASVIQFIQRLRSSPGGTPRSAPSSSASPFSKETLLPKFLDVIQ